MDSGQVDTRLIEEQMRHTRARIDRKLDVWAARTATVRSRAPWAALAVIVMSTTLVVWVRQRRTSRRFERVQPRLF